MKCHQRRQPLFFLTKGSFKLTKRLILECITITFPFEIIHAFIIYILDSLATVGLNALKCLITDFLLCLADKIQELNQNCASSFVQMLKQSGNVPVINCQLLFDCQCQLPARQLTLQWKLFDNTYLRILVCAGQLDCSLLLSRTANYKLHILKKKKQKKKPCLFILRNSRLQMTHST